MIPGSTNTLLFASTGAAEYQIERSVRFNSADSAYLSRTPSVAGNRKTWTWSGWVKRSGSLGSYNALLYVETTSTFGFRFDTSSDIRFFLNGTSSGDIRTQALYRDVSAWYHIVLALDTTQTTASDRVKLYINGVRETSFATASYPAQNYESDFNTSALHTIGRRTTGGEYFNGYLADIHFIDGQALDPTSFGEFDTNGVWQPKAYTGSYGTNGFHLPFSDNSTSAALGTDTSGNSNTWTVNNISVTAGSGNDSLVDTPTNYGTDTGAGGEVRGNYATLNPLKNVGYTLSNGNLDFAQPATGSGSVGTIALPASGKWYWEITPTNTTGEYFYGVLGEPSTSANVTTASQPSNFVMAGYVGDGRIYKNSYTAIQSGLAYRGSGYTWGVAVDVDANTIQFYVNGAAYGSSVSTALTSGVLYLPWVTSGNNSGATHAGSINFGQRQFAYTAPSGYKALCTTNLPDPVVAKPSEVMDVALYAGNGSTQTISGLGFSPDLVWIKNRAAADNHKLLDTIRGATNELESNTSDAEVANADGLTAFNSDGFDLGADVEYNTNTETYVAWTWDAGSSTVTNTDGSITSSVRANASAGFSIVTYTGNGTAGATVGHGLGVAPSLIITKPRTAQSINGSWGVYHASLGATQVLYLNQTQSANTHPGPWNNTAPTSSVFSIGTYQIVNTSSSNYVAYCFAPVAGYSAFDSYTGNGSADGPFVYTGFRPRWILLKMSSSTGNWTIIDTAREGYNVDNDPLYPNLSNAEGTTDLADILSNGFKLRTTDASVNANAGTYIYAAFAENPFKTARAR